MAQALRSAAAIVILASSGAGVAQAVEFPAHSREYPPREYTCRFEGENVPLGSVRCLRTPQGQRTAECVVAINMSSWRPSPGSCS